MKPGGEVTEVFSSVLLADDEPPPVVTPWRAPVTNGHQVAFEYVEPKPGEGSLHSRVAFVDNERPGVIVDSLEGRLPIAVGDSFAWIEDTSYQGVDAREDTFTIRWWKDMQPPIVLKLDSYAKAQSFEGNERFFVLALQNSCTGHSRIARFDRHAHEFTAWHISMPIGLSRL